jgi:hypothetical protein
MFFLGFALLAPMANIGCSGEVRIRDEYHGDWHTWNNNEDRAYRRYLSEKHEDYRDFNRLNHDEQGDYWNWRHSHSDNDAR